MADNLKDRYPVVEVGPDTQSAQAPVQAPDAAPKKPSQKSVFWYYFKNNEDLLGIVYAKRDHAYTRLRRIIVLLCTIGVTYGYTYDIDNRKSACKAGLGEQIHYNCNDLRVDLLAGPIMTFVILKAGKFFMVLYSIDAGGGPSLTAGRIIRFCSGGMLIGLTIGILVATFQDPRVIPWTEPAWRTVIIQIESLIFNVVWTAVSWWFVPDWSLLSFIGTRARHMAAADPIEAVEADLKRPVPSGRSNEAGLGNPTGLSNPTGVPHGAFPQPPFPPQHEPVMPYRDGPQYDYAANPQYGYTANQQYGYAPYPQNAYAANPQYGYAPNPQNAYAANPQYAYAPNPQYAYATNPNYGYAANPSGFPPPSGPPFPPHPAPATYYPYGPPHA